MQTNNYRPKKRNRRRKNTNVLPLVCFFVVWLFIIGIVFLVAHLRSQAPDAPETDGVSTDAENSDSDDVDSTDDEVSTDSSNNSGDAASSDTTDAEVDVPDPVTYSEATIVSAGDLLFHMAQVNYAEAVGDGGYDFSNSYKYIKDIISSADYAVANFETTLAGEDKGYSGYPAFNTPDSALTALSDAGFDMMLFANNHCYDKNLDGLLRTQQTFLDYGFDYIGAKQDPDDDAYKIVEINGIRIGMINYADDLSGGITETRYINGKTIKNDDLSYMNLYNLSLLDEFYVEVESVMGEMEDAGVDIIVAYIHWGYEYNITHNKYQERVAQELTNLGVDIIIGGHPHVIQDVEVLTSEDDPSHETLCFYSLGNLVSNQNRRSMGDTKNSTYTEGGLMVELTVRKYSTGEVIISEVTEIPTFVHRYKASNGYYVHEIVPLADALADPAGYGLTASSHGKTEAAEVYELELDVLDDVTATYNDSIVLPTIGEE